MKRIFIVGTARSGTTLLQSMLGNNNQIFSLPETHFFSKTIPKQRLLRTKHKITQEHQDFIKKFIQSINKEPLYTEYKKNPRNINQWSQYLIHLLDTLSLSENKSIWIEKTPLHLYYTDLISKNCDECLFIHTVREPIANIAALYHVGKKFPGKFRQKSLEKSFKRYKKECSITAREINKKNHTFVYHEELVNNPKKTLKDLCKFTEIEFQNKMLNHDELVEEITAKDEIWKEKNKQKELKTTDKINERLTQEQFFWLKNKVKNLNIPILNYYAR